MRQTERRRHLPAAWLAALLLALALAAVVPAAVRAAVLPMDCTMTLKSAKKAVLTWDKQDGVSTYQIYRAYSRTGTYKQIAETGKGTAKYTVRINLKKPAYYLVRGVKKRGAKTVTVSESEILSYGAALAAPEWYDYPQDFRTDADFIELMFYQGSRLPVARYEVWRSSSYGDRWKKVLTSAKEQVRDTTVRRGRYYLYKLRAVYQFGSAVYYSPFSESLEMRAVTSQPEFSIRYDSSTRTLKISAAKENGTTKLSGEIDWDNGRVVTMYNWDGGEEWLYFCDDDQIELDGGQTVWIRFTEDPLEVYEEYEEDTIVLTVYYNSYIPYQLYLDLAHESARAEIYSEMIH